MNSKIRGKSADKLFEAVLKLGSVEECYAFFEDVCTISEIQSLAQRFEVALMLDEGKTYADISKSTGASPVTISRVNRALTYGADGYKLVIGRLKHEGRNKR